MNVKRSGPFSIMFGTTPDMSHPEQISQILRYVTNDYEEVTYQVNESFVGFVEIKGPVMMSSPC